MSSKTDDATQRAERMARLYRFTLQSEVTAETRALIKGLLLAELGGRAERAPAEAEAEADEAPVTPERDGTDPLRADRRPVKGAAGPAARRRTAPPPPLASPARGLELRQPTGQGRTPMGPTAWTETNHNQRAAQELRPQSSAGAGPDPEALGARAAAALERGGAQAQETAERGAVGATAGARSGTLRKTPQQLELRLRQLVEADAGWDQLEPLALGLYHLRGDPQAAARAVELAYLHATTDQLEELIATFRERAPGFHRLIHPAVRAHLVARLWREGVGDGLAALLIQDRDLDHLQPIERLFVLERMAGGADPGASYIYFRRHRRDLLSAAAELGAHVGLTLAAFLLRVGRTAAGLGYDGDARELLEQIGEDEPERDEALGLLLDVAVERNKAGRSHYAALLVGQASPAERLKLLSQFFSATRGLGGFRDRNRPALNELLKEPLTWTPEEPELWATLSDLLVANRDLEGLLPNLFELFRAHALRFLRPLLDASLWQGPLNMHAATPRDHYWRGVALLHHYVSCGVAAEAALWEAKELVSGVRRAPTFRPPYEWRELHKAAFAWVAKNHYQLEADRVRMLQQLRVAVDFDVVAVVDLDEYVAQAEAPPPAVLTALQALADAKNAPALETRIILRRAAETHLTNADVARVWHLANERKDSDLAWRAASVLNARGALCAPVRHAWEICGEKRAAYPFQAPAKAVVDACLAGVPARIARLAYASLHVGPVLPELLALLDPGAAASRAVPAPADSLEAKVDKALGSVTWLAGARRRYRFSFEAAAGGAALPAFMQVLPANPWSLMVARLAERLGINAWGWKLSRLHSQIVDLIPRLASRQDLRRHSGRVAKWLKELTPEQRAAWQDLATLSRALADDRAAEALAGFLCRLATVLMPNHMMALTSLHAMRAPVAVLWDLEVWLLSDAYSQVRQQQGTANRVLVPNSLQRFETIVGP